MSDSSKYYSFSAADIERYYNGQMTAAERHALEKAALEDPFLADALEGYVFTFTPVADVDIIKKRLQEKERQKKAVILFSKKYNWLQVAALFLMLAGSGWLIYRLSLPGKNEIAVTTANRQNAPEKPAINHPSDTTAALTTQLAKEKQHTDESPVTKEFNNKPTVEKQDIPPVVTENKNKLKADTEQVTANQPALVATTPENRVSSTFQAPAENRTVNANKNISANAGAAVSNEATRNGETAYDKKSTVQRDSVAGLAGVQGRAQKAEMARDTGKTLNVVMQPVKEGMNEVVVVGYGAKKRATPPPPAQFEVLEPAEGWTNFNEYVTQNLKEPEELKQKTAAGEVELSFDVNKEGEAVNIKVEKSLCGTCDEEAIRLLKEGPKWKKKKNKKGKVTIHF